MMELLDFFTRAIVKASARGHLERWRPIFGQRAWWPVHEQLWEGPGYDWDMPVRRALDQQVYELAKAEGHETHQVCPHCLQIRDEAASFTRHDWCEACSQQYEWEHLAWWLLECETRRARIRELELARQFGLPVITIDEATIRHYIDGLITRDVQ